MTYGSSKTCRVQTIKKPCVGTTIKIMADGAVDGLVQLVKSGFAS